MATVAELTKMRADLVSARAGGVRRYKDQNGEEVEYKTDSEMARALASLDAEIAAASARPVNTIQFNMSKGL